MMSMATTTKGFSSLEDCLFFFHENAEKKYMGEDYEYDTYEV